MNIPAPAWRTQVLDQFAAETFDLLVIGGGIVGAGVARDAALRGLRVALVEQHDFAHGTSSRSSRLLHGGLRYLAQGRLKLVREASAEKRTLHRIAPHLVEPLPFLFPTFADNPHWRLWQLKIGVKLYDALCGFHNFGRSTWLAPPQIAAAVPALATQNLQGAVRYFDALTNDARLVLDTLRSAHRHGAALCSRLRVAQARAENQLWRCDALDTLTGATHTVRARWVVSAAGAWAQSLPHSAIPLRLTKGVHLVLDRARLPLPDAVVMTEGRRILFAIPWGRRVILGTTDTDYRGPIEEVHCDPSDAEYLLRVANRFFPAAALGLPDVQCAWAGLRPLVAAADDEHPSDASRSHLIRIARPRWLEIAGGKLTTYRLMAEHAVNKMARDLRPARPCRTADEPLVDPADARGISAVVPAEVTRAAVAHYCQNEWALTLEDVMTRRSSWQFYIADPAATAHQVAAWMAESLHWDPATTRAEVDTFVAHSAPTWLPPPAKS